MSDNRAGWSKASMQTPKKNNDREQALEQHLGNLRSLRDSYIWFDGLNQHLEQSLGATKSFEVDAHHNTE